MPDLNFMKIATPPHPLGVTRRNRSDFWRREGGGRVAAELHALIDQSVAPGSPLHPGDPARIPAAGDADGRNPGENC